MPEKRHVTWCTITKYSHETVVYVADVCKTVQSHVWWFFVGILVYLQIMVERQHCTCSIFGPDLPTELTEMRSWYWNCGWKMLVKVKKRFHHLSSITSEKLTIFFKNSLSLDFSGLSELGNRLAIWSLDLCGTFIDVLSLDFHLNLVCSSADQEHHGQQAK